MTIEEATLKIGLVVGTVVNAMETDDRFPHDPEAERSVAVITESWETLITFMYEHFPVNNDEDYEVPTLP